MDLPKTATELNNWLRQHFNTIEVTRGYVEFPIPILDTTFIWRCTPQTIACAGLSEEKLVERIARGLAEKVDTEDFGDAREILLVRRWFTCEALVKPEGYDGPWPYPEGTLQIGGRLCFWRPGLMVGPIKPEGTPLVFIE